MAKTSGIRKRWMVNSISAALLIILLAVGAFSAAMAGYYYSNMSTGLVEKAKANVGYFRNYTQKAEYLQAARSTVETFEESARLELQFLDERGAVLYSSNGLTMAGSMPKTPDILNVLSAENYDVRSWVGTYEQTGERLMAVSAPLVYNDGVVGVLRYVSSTEAVDGQLMVIVALSLAVGMAILTLIYFSNLYFVRSIVLPVADITEVAKRIAKGSYGVQMDKQFDDEIGDLTDAINDMSLRINQAEKMKSEFIASVSHELRTPLTAINGWAETMVNGEGRDEADLKKGLSIIFSEARRLTNMVEELLEFSRIEDGRFTLSVEMMDLKAELEDAVFTYRELFRREEISLTHDDCEEEFPLVEGDPERLRQVFCNLLDNAAKHGGSGKRIDTAVWREGEEAVITIRDYGAGIPEAELPHVKYKFYKGGSKARGNGIGLAVCEEIVTRHNGTLTIENANGGGCIVTVRLPMGTQVPN